MGGERGGFDRPFSMEFVIDRDELLSALQNVMRAVPGKSVIPALGGVKLTANHALALEGTDLEFFVKASVPAEVYDGGEALVPARFLFDFTKRIPAGPIAFKSDAKGHMSITAGGSHVNAFLLDPADFPQASEPEEVVVELPAAVLRGLLAQVKYAASREQYRQLMNSVFFKIARDSITAVATDGKRMAVARAAVAGQNEAEILIPARAAEEIARILADLSSDAAATVCADKNVLAVKAKNARILTRLVEGKYFPWSQVIPTDLKCVKTVGRECLLAAMQRAALVNDEKVTLRVKEDIITVTAADAAVGQLEEDLPVEGSCGALEIMFGPSLLIDALSNTGGESVDLCFSGAAGPALIKPHDIDYPLHVVMPIVQR